MRVYHNNDKVIQCIWDKDIFSSPVPAQYFIQIDEIDPVNKGLCIDLIKYGNLSIRNSDHEYKYYIINNELYVRDNWEPDIDG